MPPPLAGSHGSWLSVEIMSEPPTFLQTALLDLVSIDATSMSLYQHGRDHLCAGRVFEYKTPPKEVPTDSPFSNPDELLIQTQNSSKLLDLIREYTVMIDSRHSMRKYQDALGPCIINAEYSLNKLIEFINYLIHHRGLRLHRERLERLEKAKTQNETIESSNESDQPPCLICCKELRRLTTLRSCPQCHKVICVTCLSKLKDYRCPFCMTKWED